MTETALDSAMDEAVERLRDAVRVRGCTVAVAESLTGGQLSAAIAAAADASKWFHGGIVAYHPAVKHGLLRTPPGPVVTAETAAAMAHSAVGLLEADVSVAISGVGGPEPDDGVSAGTVFIATCRAADAPDTVLHHFSGDPLEVMHRTMLAALSSLTRAVRGQGIYDT